MRNVRFFKSRFSALWMLPLCLGSYAIHAQETCAQAREALEALQAAPIFEEFPIEQLTQVVAANMKIPFEDLDDCELSTEQ